MKILCPHCGVKGSVDDSYQGRNVKCPKCQGIFAVSKAPLAPVLAQVPESDVVETLAKAGIIEERPLDEIEQSLEENVIDWGDRPAEVGGLPTEELLGDLLARKDEPENDILASEEGLAADILTIDDVLAEDQPVTAPAKGPIVEPEDTLSWSDITLEMDQHHLDAERKNDQEGSPADLSSLDDDFGAPSDKIAPALAGVEDEPLSPTGAVASVFPAEEMVDISQTLLDDNSPTIAQPKDHEGIAPLPPLPALGLAGGVTPDPTDVKQAVQTDEIVREPYGMEKEQCWQCGKKDNVGMPFVAKDGRLYCLDCIPADETMMADKPEDLQKCLLKPHHPANETVKAEKLQGAQGHAAEGRSGFSVNADKEVRYDFTIGGILKEAWAKTKGVKGPILAGSAVMYLVLLVLASGGAFMLSFQMGVVGDLLFSVVTNAVSAIFTAGLLYMGIRKVAGKSVNWKMVFHGFPMAVSLGIASILMTILVLFGFLLLILPGIYLTVGYSLALPLILIKKMSPWQALEASRKAIHPEWWKIFGLYILMGIFAMVAMIPLGLGLIWVVPMMVVALGVVYKHLIGMDN